MAHLKRLLNLLKSNKFYPPKNKAKPSKFRSQTALTLSVIMGFHLS